MQWCWVSLAESERVHLRLKKAVVSDLHKRWLTSKWLVSNYGDLSFDFSFLLLFPVRKHSLLPPPVHWLPEVWLIDPPSTLVQQKHRFEYRFDVYCILLSEAVVFYLHGVVSLVNTHFLFLSSLMLVTTDSPIRFILFSWQEKESESIIHSVIDFVESVGLCKRWNLSRALYIQYIYKKKKTYLF